MNEVLTLIADDGTPRDVFCRVASVGQREYYQAYAVDVYPEIKFILSDYLEYKGESLADYTDHNGYQRYRVLRTYRLGQELEITATRATAEEGGIYG